MNPVSAISVARIAIGTLTFARPSLATALFGFERPAHRQLATMARLFAGREIALGAVTLLASGPARRRLVGAGLLVDAGDAATVVLGLRAGSVGALTAASVGVAGLGAVVVAARDLR